MNAVEREPVPTRVLNPNASEVRYKPKQCSFRKNEAKKKTWRPLVQAPKCPAPNGGTKSAAPKRWRPNGGVQTVAPKRWCPTGGAQMVASKRWHPNGGAQTVAPKRWRPNVPYAIYSQTPSKSLNSYLLHVGSKDDHQNLSIPIRPDWKPPTKPFYAYFWLEYPLGKKLAVVIYFPPSSVRIKA